MSLDESSVLQQETAAATGGAFHFDGSLKFFPVSVWLLPCLSSAALLWTMEKREGVSRIQKAFDLKVAFDAEQMDGKEVTMQ